MAKTFLTLVQTAYGLAGLQGAVTSVTAPGHVRLLKNKITQAWIDLQQDSSLDLTFMTAIRNFSTQQGKAVYSVPDMLGLEANLFGRTKAVIYKDNPLPYMPLGDIVLYNGRTDPATPRFYCDDAFDGAIQINTPDQIYTINLLFRLADQELQVDSDEIRMPDDTTNVVIYKGLLEYAITTGNSNLAAQATDAYNDAYASMCRKYNHEIKMEPRPFLI